MALADIVNVTITRSSRPVSQAGFGTPLILGQHTRFAEAARVYTSAAGMLSDGFLTTDLEYKAGLAAFSQAKKPTKILVGKRAASVAQINTLTPTPQATTVYSFTLNGVLITFTSSGSPTAANIVTGLIAAVSGSSQAPFVTPGGTTTLTLTAVNAGEGFSLGAITANLANVVTVANQGVVEDIASVAAVSDDWYCLILTSRSNSDIRAAAAYIESVRRIFLACSSDVTIKAATTSDVAYFLKQKSYFRTAIMFSGDNASYPDAAWAGRVLPDTPGSETWNFKQLSGVLPDKVTANEEVNIRSKNCNFFSTVAGLNIMQDGKVASGEFIDIIRLIDLIQARIQEGIYGDLTNVEKIPFTDFGGAVIESRIRSVLQKNVNSGGVASFNVQVPLVANISVTDRANRLFSGVTFDAVLAGAIHATVINGFVTV